MRLSFFPTYLVPAFLIIIGCASGPTIAPPEVPENLRAPSGEVPFLQAAASGVQIYECALKPGEPPSYGWIFRRPEATLMDRSGRLLGKHFAGPTWESNDGSSVVGAVKASYSGPSSDAIPWLLLTAKSTAGSGTFSSTTSIQRVRTVGGIAPSKACSASNAAEMARVPYNATYYFYRAAQ
jgi:Protein of unknown function (DUF3455)